MWIALGAISGLIKESKLSQVIKPTSGQIGGRQRAILAFPQFLSCLQLKITLCQSGVSWGGIF